MEPQNNLQEPVEKESFIAPLTKVTPLSKYLALALFVALPFVGGLVGYTLSPEKIVEVNVPSERASDHSKIESILVSNELETASLSIVNEDSSVFSYECTSVENPYPHKCFSFKPESSSANGVKNLTEEAKKQGVIFGRTTLQSVEYETADVSKIYFNVGIPDSDGCCGLISFDSNTYKFSKVDLYQGSDGSFSSADNRYIAMVADQSTLNILDLETEKILNRKVISTGSLVSTTCNFAGDGYDVRFNPEKLGFDYGIYSEKTEPGDECKQEKINDDFISLKQM